MNNFYYRKSPAKKASLIIWLCLFMFIIFIVWAAFAKIHQTTKATGVVIAYDRTQTVQAMDSGILTKLLVNEGDEVERGQLLIVLQEERALASLDNTLTKLASLRARIDRLNAQVTDKPLKFDNSLTEYPEYKENQRELYRRQKNALQEELAFLQSSLSFVENEITSYEPLLSIGAVSVSEILRLQQKQTEIQAQINNRKNQFYAQAQRELTEAQELLYAEEEILRDKKQQLLEKRLYAPSNGRVNRISNSTIGSVVKAGESVLEILPSDSELIVEVKVSPADIAYVKEGQRASIKLDAYDYTIFGTLVGKVKYISSDTLNEQTQMGVQPFYRVQIIIDKNELPNNTRQKEIIPKAGMTAHVDIIAQERTVLSYLTKPITKTLSESLTER